MHSSNQQTCRGSVNSLKFIGIRRASPWKQQRRWRDIGFRTGILSVFVHYKIDRLIKHVGEGAPGDRTAQPPALQVSPW